MQTPATGSEHVVITGGGGGLAQVIARVFRDAGYRVEAPSRAQLDVTDAVAAASYFSARDTALLICCAGQVHDAPLARLAPDDWQSVWDANYSGALHCARAALPGMRRLGGGHIMLFSSQSAVRPPPGQAPYATAKAALIGLARDLASNYGADNIRANVILPGFLDTPMTASVTPARRADVLGSHALGRLNTPDAVASFLLCLHRDLLHTSGQCFRLDSRD